MDAKTRKILDDYLTERIKKTNSTTAAAPAAAAAAAVPVPGAEKKEGEAEVGISQILHFTDLILSKKKRGGVGSGSFKGLSHEMDLAFDDMYGSVLGLNRGRGQFLNFVGAPMILKLEHLTLLTQCKLALTSKNTLFAL